MTELSTEQRVLLAFVLSVLVMAVWGTFFMPRPGPPTTRPAPGQPAGQAPAPATTPGAPTTLSAAAPAPASAPKAASEEKTIVIENGLYRVELSNRGGVVRSWQLKNYKDGNTPPRTLDLVHAETAQQLGVWPLWISPADLEDPQFEAHMNSALYEVTPSSVSLRAPAEVVFEWSDARLSVIKRLKFENDYVVNLDTSVRLDGRPLAHGVAWRGGFGDATVYQAPEIVQVFFRADGKLQTLVHKKLGTPDRPDGVFRQSGTMDYAGIQDHYFAAAFLPRGTGLALWHWKREADKQVKDKKEKFPVAEMAAGSTVPGPVALRLYVGPKDLDLLGRLKPPMTELVNFGWFGIFAKPLFYFLKWIYGYVPNYGWAIILMTIIINMVLFPLKVKSWRSMQRMQKVAPEVRSIQERYKKYSMTDPRKKKMNEEVWAVYRREGVNPMGGCLPMVIQMPIWIALYQMLNVTIELRHAPWLGWIKDLSAPDPWYILPVVMAVTMYWMQKMTPMTTADPAQQQMMKMMPIMFGLMFVIFPVSSGLVLYILSSNLVAMAQQWYLNRTVPATVNITGGKARRK